MLRIFLCYFWLFNFIPDADVKKQYRLSSWNLILFFSILKNFSVLIRLCALLFQNWLINPPGSTSKFFLQFSKNRFTIPNPVMAISQGGVIKINVFQGRRIAFGIVDDQLNCTGSVCHYRHYRIKRATDSIRLFGLLVRRVLSAKPAIFIKLQLIRRCSLILGRRIISSFAFSAC